MSANPIHKTIVGRRVRSIALTGWAYTCPICDKEVKPSYYGMRGATRKQAKDALHRHRIINHGAPR